MSRELPSEWRLSGAILATVGWILFGVALPAGGAVPPAGGGTGPSGGASFGGISGTPGASAGASSFNRVPPAMASPSISNVPSSATSASGATPSFPSASSIIQANGGSLGLSAVPRLSFQGQGSATGAFGSNFPGQAGVGGDFRGPAGAAGGVVGGSASSPTVPQSNPQPMATGATAASLPASNLVVGSNSNPLLVGGAAKPGLTQTPNGAPATSVAQTNDWRYVNYNGNLWYWAPTNSWLYYQNGAWQAFSQPSASQPSTVTQSAGQTPYTAGGSLTPGATTVVR